MFPALLLLTAIASADVICPLYRSVVVETSLVFSSDQYRGLPPSSPPCSFTVQSATGSNLLVSVSTSTSFSLRQPMSRSDLIIRDSYDVLVVERVPQMYRLLSSRVFVEIPTSLSFRAVVVISATVDCQGDSYRCSGTCDRPAAQNCSSVCLPSSVRCDSVYNCGGDEEGCGNDTEKNSFRYHTILRSSQLMLVGFFVLNGAFILFFLMLSVCSVSACFSRKLFREKSRASRMTFIKYLREASATGGGASSPKRNPPSVADRRPVEPVFSRINFAPSPALRELEPEVEDRSVRAPKEEICSIPSYQPQLYIRRQSLPAAHNPRHVAVKWKRTSVAH